jgi:CBS domain containing-hemolysin-like protein
VELPLWLGLTVALAAVFELFLVASYEATFTIVSRSVLERLAEDGTPRAHWMVRVYEPRHRVRLMGRVGAAMGIMGLALALHQSLRTLLPLAPRSGLYALTAAALGTLALFLLVSTPRRIRFQGEAEEIHVPAVALAFVPLHAILVPLTNLLDHLTSGDYTDEDLRAEKEEELRNIVDAESESGLLDEGEREMIQGVFGFHDRIVRQVMVPRVDVVGVETGDTLGSLLERIRETGHSRLPLYDETLDRIQGIVYAKELLQLLLDGRPIDLTAPVGAVLAGGGDGTVDHGRWVHAPYYVPETKKIDELLHDLRAHKTRMAIVVDEYGGTAGLVSAEDLVEEIVGEIHDEYDDEEEPYTWIEPDRVLQANARLTIDRLNELLDTDLPNEGFETLAGFIFDHLGRIPEEGESFSAGSLTIAILKVEGQRIAQVRVTRASASDLGAAN